MKKNRRLLLIVLSLLVCVALGLSALGEGTLSSLFIAATELAFDTNNVSLKADATFAYDGKLFKTLRGKYVQDGGRSLMEVMLDTPMKDGSVYTGGYTVVGEGTTAYAVDTYNDGYYTTTGVNYCDTLLRSDASTKALMDFGKLFIDMAEGFVGGAITTADAADGRQYAIKLQSGDVPAVVNAALTLAAQNVAQRKFGIQPAVDRSTGDYCLVEFADWDALFATMYQKVQGEAMPENFFDKLWGADEAESRRLYAVYNKVCAELDALSSAQYARYNTGVSLIQPDGSVSRFETYEEFILADGSQYTIYEDSDKAFQAYYASVTGQELTDDDYTALQYSANEDLWTAFYEMWEAMDAQYVQLAKDDGKAICARVHADGTYTLLYDVDDTYDYSDSTVKYQILYTMRSLALDSADCVFTLDSQGRFTAGKGTAVFHVMDAAGAAHPLEITFDAAASDYGTSAVKDFDPADYNVTDFETFWAENGNKVRAEEEFPYEGDMESAGMLEKLPKTIVFNGVEYETYVGEHADD